MNRSQKTALLTELIIRLRKHESWCGETHIQKCVYFLENLFELPIFGFEFVLYRHGPFSFDLRDELTSMRADGFLELETQPPPYGPRINATEDALQFKKHYPITLNKFKKQLDFIIKKFGDKNAVDLEKLSTALLINKQEENKTELERAQEINELKPHISIVNALEAINNVNNILREAQSIK